MKKKVLHNGFGFAYTLESKKKSIYSDFPVESIRVCRCWRGDEAKEKYCMLNDSTSPVTPGDWVWNIFFNLFAHISSVKNY